MTHQAACVVCGEVLVSMVAGGSLIHIPTPAIMARTNRRNIARVPSGGGSGTGSDDDAIHTTSCAFTGLIGGGQTGHGWYLWDCRGRRHGVSACGSTRPALSVRRSKTRYDLTLTTARLARVSPTLNATFLK